MLNCAGCHSELSATDEALHRSGEARCRIDDGKPLCIKCDDHERGLEQSMALALVPLGQEIADYVRAKLPPDLPWGVFLFAKPLPGQRAGRVIAITSNRDVVAPLVAQWTLSVLPGKR